VNRAFVPAAGVALLFVTLTAAMTWPQVLHLGTHVYDNDDPLLSIWRVSWIAHILPERPADLFNGNIFYPEPRTLAYSDATLLQGMAAAPLIWAGVSQVTTYNLLLLASIALSGWAMWCYARHLTGSAAAALLAGIIFAFVPYRFDHYHHLELQAAFFLPLTLLFFERATEARRNPGDSRRAKANGWLMLAAFVGQVYSCIYYAVFLATAMVPIAAVRVWLTAPATRTAFLRAAGPALAVSALFVLPYLYAYGLNRETLGDRLDRDVRLYSATWLNFLATTDANVMHGGSVVYGQPERYLFPGLLAVVLAAFGLNAFDRRRVTLVAVGIFGLVIALGLNTPFYEPLRAIVLPYRGLRAPARASILLFLALAALAAYGWARLIRGRSRTTVAIATLVAALALLAEYRTTLNRWLTPPDRPAEVYQWLAQQPRSVVAEVPFARADQLHSISDGLYMFNSTWHWQPIVNGYSGYFPATFIELSRETEGFPDERAIAYLKKRGVDLIVLHGGLLGPEVLGEMTAILIARPDIEALARFEELRGSDVVLRLRR
jgi:hypothetical protein